MIEKQTTDLLASLRAIGEMPLEGGRTDPLIEVMNSLAHQAADEIERLQRVIDSRPAINAGLPETYIKWSQSIYVMECAHITGWKL